jgi:segregation and condensation protein A
MSQDNDATPKADTTPPIETISTTENSSDAPVATISAPAPDQEEVNEHAFETTLDAFSGPLDLLLYLIKINEVDIYDIPIKDITKQYLNMVKVIEQIDMDQAAEFLIMASTLIEIKSRILIPREEIEIDDIEDPRADLVEQLLEYRKFRELAGDLGHRFDLRQQQFDRVLGRREQKKAALPVSRDDRDLDDLEVWDLFRIFDRIASETLGFVGKLKMKEAEVSTIEFFMIISKSIRNGNMKSSFRYLIKNAPDRTYVVGLFVALLEMAKQRKITMKESADFSDIEIFPTQISGDNLETFGSSVEDYDHPADVL